MPFRKLFGAKANLVILLAILVLTIAFAFGVMGVLIILRKRLTDLMVLELVKVILSMGGVVGIVAVLLRSAANASGIEKVAQNTQETHDVVRNGLTETVKEIESKLAQNSKVIRDVAERTDGGLTNAVNAAGEQVRLAERDQLINDEKFCNDLARKIATELRNPPEPPKVQT